MSAPLLTIPLAGDGAIRELAASAASPPWARWFAGNPFESEPSAGAGARLALWSGSMASWDADPDGLAAPDPRTWSAAGWERLEEACRALAAAAKDASEVLFRTHASHILSDVPSCLRFLRQVEQWGGRGGLLLDPAAMLTASMLPAAPDHLERVFANLGPHPATAAVVLSNVTSPDPEDPMRPLRTAPLHRGLLDPVLLVTLLRRHVPRETPVVLLDEEIGAQTPLLADPLPRS